MARCGWCKRTGLKPDADPDLPQDHTVPRGGSKCRGYGSYLAIGEETYKRTMERAAMGTLE